jgi:hypothetical protein
LTYIKELQDVIKQLHGGEATHVESVPVKEVFQGRTIWEGIVEVFDLEGHPKANRVYAWTHETDMPEHPTRHVAVLHIHPVTSPVMAVRAAIREEIRNLGTAEAE